MALSSLMYEGLHRGEETRSGVIIYDGSAHRFKVWRFLTELEFMTAKEDSDKKRMENTAEIVKSLAQRGSLYRDGYWYGRADET